MTQPRRNSPEQLRLSTMDIAAWKGGLLRQYIAATFPEVASDGTLDFDHLMRLLGPWTAPGRERFGLDWPGKANCVRVIQTPSTGTLRPCTDTSVDWETTQNLFIEGDNLEVLKLLQKAYFESVRMIYIDPPYNSGKDFIYPDRYSETLETYLAYTGQIDAAGRRFSTNTDTSGRYHSRWLSMMYPRLYLSRNLLRPDGCISISIDDREHAHLKAICDQIFGERNLVASLAWQKVFAKKNKAQVSGSHDHILLYAKDVDSWRRRLLPRTDNQLDAYTNPDHDARGPWQSVSFSVTSEDSSRRARYRYEIELPSGRSVRPPAGRHWNGLRPKFKRLLAENRIWFGTVGNSAPRVKVFLSEVQPGIVPDTWWKHEDTGNNQEAKKEILELFEGSEPYSTPKPTRLVRRMLQIATDPNAGDLVLDFFAGSSSTAHAVMLQNAEDGGNRRFLLVQLPEPVKNGDFRSISEIGLERIRRAAPQVRATAAHSGVDLGVRYFRLTASCFRRWDGQTSGLGEGHLLYKIASHANVIQPEATEDQILFELLLNDGFPLTVPIEPQNIAGKRVYSVADGRLLICLEPAVTQALMDALAEIAPPRLICLDAAFQGQDELKANAAHAFKARARLKETAIRFHTV